MQSKMTNRPDPKSNDAKASQEGMFKPAKCSMCGIAIPQGDKKTCGGCALKNGGSPTPENPIRARSRM